MRVAYHLFLAAIVLSSGCTSQSTRQAIKSYQRTERDKQQLVDESLRQSEQFLFLSLQQFLDANSKDPQKVKAAVRSAWEARSGIEKIRLQYAYQRALTTVTVGAYLYDQQGWLNTLTSSTSDDLTIFSAGLDAGNVAAGTTRPADLVK